MKKTNRLAHVPARTPFQDYLATQRRMVWAERAGKFAVGPVFVAVAFGFLGA